MNIASNGGEGIPPKEIRREAGRYKVPPVYHKHRARCSLLNSHSHPMSLHYWLPFTDRKLSRREVMWPAQEHVAVSDKLSSVCLMQGIVCPLSHQPAEGGSKEIQDGKPKAAHILHSS